MTILVIKSPPTQNLPVIKSPPQSKSSIYLYLTPPPQPSTQHDIFFNQSILTLTNFTKMSFSLTPRRWITESHRALPRWRRSIRIRHSTFDASRISKIHVEKSFTAATLRRHGGSTAFKEAELATRQGLYRW